MKNTCSTLDHSNCILFHISVCIPVLVPVFIHWRWPADYITRYQRPSLFASFSAVNNDLAFALCLPPSFFVFFFFLFLLSSFCKYLLLALYQIPILLSLRPPSSSFKPGSSTGSHSFSSFYALTHFFC